ncbi:MAG: DUF5337 domain-containing protein [Sedimentitalea sp.]
MSTSNQDTNAMIARKGRHVSVVIAGTMVIWFIAQMLAPQIGLAGRYALLFDLAALAALIYAFVNIFQIWRLRQSNQG